jgi:hypothetical protein
MRFFREILAAHIDKRGALCYNIKEKSKRRNGAANPAEQHRVMF